MASSDGILCGLCECQHITQTAAHWCPECEEGLCNKCHQIHGLSKASRKHVTITIENYKKIPEFVSNIGDNCKEHDMKFTIYCSKHDSICCPVCVSSDHKACVDFKAISEIIHNSKTSSLISSLEKDLEKLRSFSDLAVKKQDENLLSLRQQIETFTNKINEVRKSINTHLDLIEQKIKLELKEAEIKAVENIEKVTRDLSGSSKRLNELENNLTALKMYGSDLQTFFGVKRVEVEKDKERQNLTRISDDGSLKHTIIKGEIDNGLVDISTILKSFGSVLVELAPQQLAFGDENTKQEWIQTAGHQSSHRSITDTKLTLISSVEYQTFEPEIKVNGCTISPDGKLTVADYMGNKICILNHNGSADRNIPLSFYPYDVTFIDTKTLAVSSGKGITIINTNDNNIKQEIKRSNRCYGITYHQGTLLWCEYTIGIQKMKIPDREVCTLISQNTLPHWSFLSLSNERIYQTNQNAATVSCFTIDGNKIWEYKDKSVLRYPFGITADSNSNVYVTSRGDHKVIIISHDGTQAKQLLDENDGLKKPIGISFDKHTNNLYVCNELGPDFLYNVSQI